MIVEQVQKFWEGTMEGETKMNEAEVEIGSRIFAETPRHNH